MRLAAIVPLLLAAGSFAQSPENKPIPKENPYTSEADLARGKQLFLGHCAPCHGPEGAGGKGANLARPRLPRAADDQALFKVVRDGIPGTEMPGAWEMIDHELWQVAGFVRTLGRVAPEEHVAGDRAHGEALVRGKGNCLQCHLIGGEGKAVGPPLTEVGLRRDAAFLRKTLLDPRSTLPEFYVYLELTTKDQKKISGIRTGEDTYTIQVRDLSGGIRSFLKSDLAAIHRDAAHTPMPAFRGAFSDAELDDAVAYLTTLRGAQ